MLTDYEPSDALEAAMLAESLATLNGLHTLLECLAAKRVIDRGDIASIAKSMSKAFELPQVRGNIYVHQLQRNTDEFLAGLIAKVSDG